MDYTTIVAAISIILGAFFLVIETLCKIKDAIEITKKLVDTISKKEKFNAEKIKIFLENESGQTLFLPYSPRREKLTRGELGGIFGMFAGGRRYNIPGISKIFYSGAFDEILEGKSNILTVTCPENEFLLFSKFIEEEINCPKKSRQGTLEK